MYDFARDYISKTPKRYYHFEVFTLDQKKYVRDYDSYGIDYQSIFEELYNDPQTTRIIVRPFGKNGNSKKTHTPMEVVKQQPKATTQTTLAGTMPGIGQGADFQTMFLNGLTSNNHDLKSQLQQANEKVQSLKDKNQSLELELKVTQMELKQTQNAKPSMLEGLVQQLPGLAGMLPEMLAAFQAQQQAGASQPALSGPQMGNSEVINNVSAFLGLQNDDVQLAFFNLISTAADAMQTNPGIIEQTILYIKENSLKVAR